MRARFIFTALACLPLAFATLLAADKEEKKFDCKCPVSGQPAKEESSVAYRGRKVYFCCDNCPDSFKADRKKFGAAANHQLLVTGQLTQIACPLTGRKVNPDKTVEVNGVSVGLCCDGCLGKAKKSDNLVALLFTKTDKGFTLQTECPVSGEPIDVTKVVEHDGKNVYFCCEKCPKAFTDDPEKFEEKLPQFAEDAADEEDDA